MQPSNNTPPIRFTEFSGAWKQREFGNIVSEYADPVATPTNGYYRLGIKSHAKGTFHSYVRPGMELSTAQMYRVAANNFIVNITFGWEHAVAITTEEDSGKLVSHRFPQFSFSEGMLPEYFKFVIIDEKFKHHLWLASPGGAGRNRVLKISEMLEYKFWVPSQEEQQKIALFLTNLDNLINLHQRKHDQLVNIKKSMLNKMFPKNGESVPAVRFTGFTDAWEQRRLGDEGSTYSGLSGKTKADFGHGEGKFITYMNVFSNPISSPIDVELVVKDNSQKEVQVGDIFFTTSSETPEEVGMSSVLAEIHGITYLNSFCFGFRPSSKIDVYYWAYMLRSGVVRRQIIRLAQGISRYNISKNKMMDIDIPLPSSDEQKKIGTLLVKLDDLITLHRHKLERLQNIKKACLIKMFV